MTAVEGAGDVAPTSRFRTSPSSRLYQSIVNSPARRLADRPISRRNCGLDASRSTASAIASIWSYAVMKPSVPWRTTVPLLGEVTTGRPVDIASMTALAHPSQVEGNRSMSNRRSHSRTCERGTGPMMSTTSLCWSTADCSI